MAEDAEKLDLVWGAAEIAVIIGKTPRATFHLLEGGKLPAAKLNGRWVTDRATLTAFFRGAFENSGAA